MHTALETLFFNIPKKCRILPENDPEASAQIEELCRDMNEEKRRLFLQFIDRSNFLFDEQAFQCFVYGIRYGFSLGTALWNAGDYLYEIDDMQD